MTDQIGQEIGNKMSARSFGWNKPTIQERVFANKDMDIFLYRVGGTATGLRKYKVPADQVKDGEDSGFGLSGQFVGVGSLNGEEVKGSVLYLPKYVHEMVEAALSLGDDVAGVNIGFDVYARYDEKSATSYTFVARDLLNEVSKPLEEVKAKIFALPLPTQTTAPQLTDKTKK